MSDPITAEALVRIANDTHQRASLMRRSGGLLGWWRERNFVSSIDRFADAVRAMPQSEVETAPAAAIQSIGAMVDAIIEDVERFIDDHRASNLKRVERDRHLVRRIYELRASYEKLARGVTATSGMTDLRWKVKMDAAHRGDQ
jgi:hypothetical protein